MCGGYPFLLAVYRMCMVSSPFSPLANHWQGSFWGKAESAARAGEKQVSWVGPGKRAQPNVLFLKPCLFLEQCETFLKSIPSGLALNM